MDYRVRRAQKRDVPNIMCFIEEHWKRGHLLGHDANFLQYLYGTEGEDVNFFLAEKEEGAEIAAMEGFISYFDRDRKNVDVCLSIWKSAEASNQAGLLPLQAILNMGADGVFSVGINPKTSGVYRFLGFTVGVMDHWYRLQDKQTYHVAKINEKRIPSVQSSGGHLFHLPHMAAFRSHMPEEILLRSRPYKSWHYIQHRYYDHPIYRYKLYGLRTPGEAMAKTAIVTREILQNGAKVCRIVDILGAAGNMAFGASALDALLCREDFEYIDCYCVGVDPSIMERAGFVKRSDRDPNIIPNYFEPFVQKNVDIHYTCTDMTPFRIFKGDGDQDRPNRAPAKI